MRWGRIVSAILVLVIMSTASFFAGSATSVFSEGNSITPTAVFYIASPRGIPEWWVKIVLSEKEVIPPTFVGNATCPQDAARVVELVGGSASEWHSQQEEGGTAWVFLSSDGGEKQLRVLYGTLDFPGGTVGATSSVKAMAATYRCSVTVASASTPSSAPASGSSCVLGRDLAARNGWTVVSEPSSVSVYGGAVVQLPAGVSLPPGWEFSGAPGAKPSDGGIFTIYPPNDGACRQQLGVSR